LRRISVAKLSTRIYPEGISQEIAEGSNRDEILRFAQDDGLISARSPLLERQRMRRRFGGARCGNDNLGDSI